MARPKLLVISHVSPLDCRAGQQMRVRNKLRAFRARFHVTLLTAVPDGQRAEFEEGVASLVDRAIVLGSRFHQSAIHKWYHRLRGRVQMLVDGLKFSNYVIGKLEFSPARIARALDGDSFDVVVYEYWHAFESTRVFRKSGARVVLDMHNLLWQVLERELGKQRLFAAWHRHRAKRYRAAEEGAWASFDGLIAINRSEERYASEHLLAQQRLFYAPMGIDLTEWRYGYAPPLRPIRLAYYGGLGSKRNAADAMRVAKGIMPKVWELDEGAELWIVGSNPPPHIQELAADSRIRVCGYVEDVGAELAQVHVVLCPWVGQYGFRSRLIEVMAVGVPIVASPDAVDGMELVDGKGLFLRESDEAMAACALELASDPELAGKTSRVARAEVERLYGFANSYSRLTEELHDWCEAGDALRPSNLNQG